VHLRTIVRRAAWGALCALAAACATAPPVTAPRAARGGYIDVGLASRAAPFESFTRHAAAIDPGFSGPGAVAQGLAAGAAYEPQQLEAGMIAYAAMAALQEPGFVAAVRAAPREQVRRLAADPEAALALPGAQAAAARANAALQRRGEALADAGLRVKKAAYAVQRQPWSRGRAPDARATLSQVRAASGYQRRSDDAVQLAAAVSEPGRRGGPSPVVTRGVALAALTVLGQDGGAYALMAEPRSGMCLRMAKLNFHQCLASAGTHYENIYCLGTHAMAETGQCVMDATRPARARLAAN